MSALTKAAKKTAKKGLAQTAVKKLASALEAAAAKATPPEADLVGRQVRLVKAGLPSLFRNTLGKVTAKVADGSVRVKKISGSTEIFALKDVYFLTGEETPPLKETPIDLRSLNSLYKKLAQIECGNCVEEQLPATMMHSCHMMVAWHEIGARARTAGDIWPPDKFQLVNFHLLESVLLQPDSASEIKAQWRDQWSVLLPDFSRKAFVVAPLCHAHHWTLLCLTRDAVLGCQWRVTYYDSLPEPSLAVRNFADSALAALVSVLGEDNVADHLLPPVSDCHKQADSVHCGWFVLGWIEELYRLYRGEGVWRANLTGVGMRDCCLKVNKFAKSAVGFKADKGLAAAATETAALAVKSDEIAFAAASAAVAAAAAEGAKIKLTGEPLAVEVFGCSRCRFSKGGCLSCNPDKMMAAAAKKAGTISGTT